MSFCRSEQTPRILLIMCVWGIFPLTTDQFPVLPGFNLLLYPVSVTGPHGPHTLLIPVTTTERNTQHNQSPLANSSKISSQSLSKPLNPNSAFLQPEPARGAAPDPAPGLGPAPDPTLGLHTLPSEASVLQGQMSSFFPSNVPLQVYSFIQQAVISDSGSSEEGGAAQVVYMLPVPVDSPNMGVMEGSAPVPDPGHLHVPVTTSAPATAARPDARGQLGKTPATETATRTDILGKKGL